MVVGDVLLALVAEERDDGLELGTLPAQRMWLWSRRGDLQVGDHAPMFTLSTYNHQSQVSLASHRGKEPVVLVFGSYT